MSKVMLVTGASRGIGAEVAKLAGTRGYRVVVNFNRSEKPALDVVDSIRTAGGEAVAIHADVSKSADVARLFAELDRTFGQLDVLVNNAGKLMKFRVDETDEAQLIDAFAANVFSVFLCTKEAVRRMSTRHGGKGGVVVNMSSVAARLGGLGGGAAYAATKGALDSFSLALAKEVGTEGIRVANVRPGLIATEIHELHGGLAQMEQLAKTVPMGRSGKASEIAEAVLWLASDGASYVHGATLDVSGGR